jgi:hypothetical protein
MGLSRYLSYAAAPLALALVLAFVVGGAGARVFDEPSVAAFAPQASNSRSPLNVGLPSITGTAVAGNQLTGDVGDWRRSGTVSYVWQRCDANGGACANQQEKTLTYTLGTGDVGTRVRLLVTVSSKFGVTSAASALTAVVAPAPTSPAPPPPTTAPQPPRLTTAPTVSGSAVDGKTLTASPGSWSGDSPMSYRYGWVRCGSSCVSISGASNSQYTLSQADVGMQVAVSVVASNTAGSASATSPRTATVVEPTPAVAPSVTSAPTVSGTPQVGQTLTATAGSWGGTTPISTAVQWRRCSAAGDACTDISSATGSTYAPVSSDVGGTIRVAVTATNVAGSATVVSSATGTVSAAPTPLPSSGTKFRVGVIANVAGYGAPMQQKVLSIGAKIIREDRGDYGLTWAKANGVTADCIIWMDPASPGANCPIVELDNEPYNNNVWINGDVNAWAKKALSVAQQVKAAHPNAIVLLPVGPPWNNGDIKEPNGTMRDCVLAINDAAPTIWNYVDGIAIHPYSQPAAPVPGRFPVLDKWRSNLKAIGHGSLPFWVTELGWPTSGTNWSPAQTEQQQSDYLAQFISTAKARGDVAAVIAYQLQDWGPRDSDSEHWFGVLNADGSPKVAYGTLKQLIAANP